MQFKSFGFSDVGKIRDHNEDSYLCNDKEGLFVIADGMGGHAYGETASQLAVNSVEQFVIQSRSQGREHRLPPQEGLSEEQTRLLSAAAFANRRIREVASQNPDMRGMGTTLVGAIIEGDRLAVVNVGDSRLYRIRQGTITQLTRDHTMVMDQERSGMLSNEEARRHPQRHVLTSALGTHARPRTALCTVAIESGDLFLICSDGLYTVLEDDEILSVVGSVRDNSLYKIGLSLVLRANLAGGQDDTTVVLLSFRDE